MQRQKPAEQPRSYRTRMAREGLVGFRVVVKETDLMVLAERDLRAEVLEAVLQERQQLESYIDRHPEFLTTLVPYPFDPYAPPVVRAMLRAGLLAGVGPMAAVAGALAARVGEGLLAHSSEIIVENGGDIFLHLVRPAVVALHAGRSPLSDRVGIRLTPAGPCSWGVCTSSGTVGHSLSFGRADAACVVATDAALADACATALGNRIKSASDMEPGLAWLAEIPGILGAVVIVGERLGVWGQLELVPLP